MTFLCGDDQAGGALRILAKLADCCAGAIENGPVHCTCWEPEYDRRQVAELKPPAIAAWPTMCDDCAYRSSSPENHGDDRYTERPEHGTQPFWCHRGMRKVVGWRHPAGIYIEADGDYYEPPGRMLVTTKFAGAVAERTPVPYQADGQPAKQCAGWAARERDIRTKAISADVTP